MRSRLVARYYTGPLGPPRGGRRRLGASCSRAGGGRGARSGGRGGRAARPPRLGAPPDAPSPRPARRPRSPARGGAGARLRPRRLRRLRPAPGQRLRVRRRRVLLVFTEPLNARLARRDAAAGGRRRRGAGHGARRRARGRLVVARGAPLERGAYRVDWHTVSTRDGHALEGAFSFGVRRRRRRGAGARDGPLARARLGARSSPRSRSTRPCSCSSRRCCCRCWSAARAAGRCPTLARATRRPVDLAARPRRRLRGDLAWAAVAAAVAATLADAADAARGLDPGAAGATTWSGNIAGAGRALAVVALLAAALLRDRRPRAAAARGRARARRGRRLGPRRLGRPARAEHPQRLAAPRRGRAVARRDRPARAGVVARVRFTRRGSRGSPSPATCSRRSAASPPAFALAVATGLVSAWSRSSAASTRCGTPATAACWRSRSRSSALIAAASAVHALRLRPRLLAANRARRRLERRHWRLLRTEPWLGPRSSPPSPGSSPSRSRRASSARRRGARPPVCDPCPLPRPRADELRGGRARPARSSWPRGSARAPRASTGTVRVLDRRGRRRPRAGRAAPARAPARCGAGCRRFRLPRPPADTVDVAVREHGAATGGCRRAGSRRQRARAPRCSRRAEAAMRGLRGVRELERVTSGPGTLRASPSTGCARPTAWPGAPAAACRAWWSATASGSAPGQPWREGEYGSGLPFRTRSLVRLAPLRARGPAARARRRPASPSWR